MAEKLLVVNDPSSSLVAVQRGLILQSRKFMLILATPKKWVLAYSGGF